ncbi:MAG: ribonuclease J [Clostridia bacterium]|nr:ribonuclease J [Clostridia bacterium]
MRKRNKNGETSELRIIPLGGLNEIGKNLTVLEYGDDIMIIDCGMSFPEDEMYGVDIVIPDFSYLQRNTDKIRGIVITHGHEDHIGAIPYLLRQFNVPIYGTRLTLGLIENKLKEHQLTAELINIKAGDRFSLGVFGIETIKTTHSIADAVCFAIDTPLGKIFHTGDFKVDYTPVDGVPIDMSRIAQLGQDGVLLMMADSTNAVRPGFTASESVVGMTLENIFRGAENRIIIATFSSNVHRVQRIVDNAVMFRRKVAISGRSMVNVMNLAIELGYLSVPEGVLVDINAIKNIPDDELVIITTGSQGEPMSALARIASSEHRAVQIKRGDIVILSSTPVPGNEKMVSNVVNKLFEKGAEVIYSDIADIHVSGHACQEELKLIHSLVKPKFFMPVHGEYRHLKQHAHIAESLGMNGNDIFILKNGNILSLRKEMLDVPVEPEKVIPQKVKTKEKNAPDGKAAKTAKAPRQKTRTRRMEVTTAAIAEETVPANPVMVDGLGVGDVGNIVLRDRKLLSESGLVILVAVFDMNSKQLVSGPDIVSRGFIYLRENDELIEKTRDIAEAVLLDCCRSTKSDWYNWKTRVRDAVRSYIFEKTKRSPVILPIFMEV